MDLYSNAIVFSRGFVKDDPKAVAGFLKAIGTKTTAWPTPGPRWTR